MINQTNLTTSGTCESVPPPATPAPPGAAVSESIDERQFQRRVKLFKRAGMIGQTQSSTTHVTQAKGTEQLKAAYRLVHDTFVDQGYILPTPGGIRVRPFEALPEMATFVALNDEEEVVAVMSVVPDTPHLDLPSDTAFKTELDALRLQGRRLGEVTNLAVTPEYRNSNVFLELARYMQAHAISVGLDDIFIAISPGHSAFFETFLCFEERGGPRNYGGQVHDTVEGMTLNLRTAAERAAFSDQLLGDDAFLYDWFFVSNPHLDRAPIEHAEARRAFLDPQNLHELFGPVTGLLTGASARESQALRAQWGDALFDQITDASTLKAAS